MRGEQERQDGARAVTSEQIAPTGGAKLIIHGTQCSFVAAGRDCLHPSGVSHTVRWWYRLLGVGGRLEATPHTFARTCLSFFTGKTACPAIPRPEGDD